MTQNTPKRKPAQQPARRPAQQQPARRPASRAAYIRAQRKKQRMQILFLAGLAVLLIAIIIIIITASGSGREDIAKPAAAQPAETVSAAATIEPTATPEPTAVPSMKDHGANPAYAAHRPSAEEGYLPIFRGANTQEKIIAITVDDCYQADNFRKIVDLALQYNGKLTIFPIGENAVKPAQAEVLRYAWENGMEIENHTYTHNGLFNCSNEELAKEMYMQNLAISHVLNVEYQGHFIRPKGGDARDDQRIHAYAKQLGYYGIAHWNELGDRDAETLKQRLKPGNLYLFHTTDRDLQIMEFFIPYAVSQGYRLVTMNEMFGYPSNEYTELTIPIEEHTVPPLEDYEIAPRTYQDGDYAYAVKVIQNRLKALGYLKNPGDGVYGEGTANAVKKFQEKAGMKRTGKVDPDTLARLFADNAPKR